MLGPFINLISNVISLINLALTVWMVLGLLLYFDIVNRHNPLVYRIYDTLGRLLEPLLAPLRRALARVLPDTGGLDLSPIALILLLHFVDNAMYRWFFEI